MESSVLTIGVKFSAKIFKKSLDFYHRVKKSKVKLPKSNEKKRKIFLKSIDSYKNRIKITLSLPENIFYPLHSVTFFSFLYFLAC